MRLNEIKYGDAVPVEGYGPGFFRIAGQKIHGGLIVLPELITPWEGFDALDPLIAHAKAIDVLFVGTGAETRHLPAAMREKLDAAGLGVEAMNSPAACRTYNVLLSEGRRIGLAVLPV